ncbi:peptidase U62 modulator of DNA gyrase [Methanosalsum zhilinae DSM 4017]|uniref:Peptidase U62 modulator of DNA gyrase n=1 Tax=Methanosalsum zhilinae (strain DSM 4017 / NBRC 107636 / OCM 62 / WeN5) TaxID=679901 RepID=F7XLH1_METZD|nr:TldD/PmbA family protein [Methanosalsum zhilinae]AEH60639.1 peptidase U62 modulator of DNA gyrase [Methanosalsum zhilinae DSM 4017]
MSEIDFFDARLVDGTGTIITLDNGDVDDISINYSQGAGVRALCNGSWGFTSVEGKFDLKNVIKSAKELSIQMNSYSPAEKIELAPVEAPVVRNAPVTKINPKDVSIEEKVELLKEIEKHARVDGVKSTNVMYAESEMIFRYCNSEGVECEYETIRTGFAVTAVAAENNKYQVGRESRFGVCGYELFDDHNAYHLAESAGKTAVELLSAENSPAGNLPVILDQELAGVFVHEAVGHASEADLVLEGNSILKDKRGESIASPLVNVIDDPTLHEYGYFPFDAEGVQSRKNTIIKDGILNSYLHSRETANKLGGIPGNFRTQGYSLPVVRMSNTYIDNGESGFEEMLEEMKSGVYLMGSRGGQVNTGEGIFQFNAEKGYLIENGEMTTLLKNVSLSGKTLEILKNVEMVGNDLKMHSGRCGKSGQLVPVADGSPHIMISKALVGGV